MNLKHFEIELVPSPKGIKPFPRTTDRIITVVERGLIDACYRRKYVKFSEWMTWSPTFDRHARQTL